MAQISQNDVDLPQNSVGPSNISNGLRIVFGVAGAIALLMITVGGFKYVLSRGNPQETAKAKDTILYALLGLVLVMLAFAIVSFVVTRT